MATIDAQGNAHDRTGRFAGGGSSAPTSTLELPAPTTEEVGLAGVPVPEGYVDLPAHSYGEDGRCTACGKERPSETYEQYVQWFYAEEWEGEEGHGPRDEEMFTYLNATCLGADS